MATKAICAAFTMALIIGIGSAHAQRQQIPEPVLRYGCPADVSAQLLTDDSQWTAPARRVRLTGLDIVEIRNRQVFTCTYGSAGTLRRDAPTGYDCRTEAGGLDIANPSRTSFRCARNSTTRDNR